MDIVRPPQKKTGRNILIALGVLGIAVLTWGLSRLEPAAPSVEGATLLSDSVRRGDVTREVRGPGTLVAERVLFITPQANGRIQRVVALAGTTMVPGQVILEMSSPEQEISTMRAQQAVRQEQLNLANLRNQLTLQRSQQEVALAAAKTANVDAQQRAMEADSLSRNALSKFELNRIKSAAEEAATRLRVATDQLAMTIQAADSQLAVAAANVEALKNVASNEEERLKSLIVRAPEAGVLQQDVAWMPGQWVASGTTVGKIVQTEKLKAVLRIPESQARDVTIGQKAFIDVRSGPPIQGRVSRKDPTAQGGSVVIDVSLEGKLPPGAVPDLGIDGLVEIEKMANILYTGRPVSGAATGPVGLFKYVDDGKYAVRVTVRLGRSSVNAVEILDGLQVGDRVVLSAMEAYDNVDRVRIK